MRNVPTRSAHRRRRLRLVRMVAGFLLTGGTLLAMVLGVVAIRLSQGPIDLPSLTPRIAAALQDRLGGATAFTLGSVALETGPHGPHLTVRDLALKGAGGRTIVAAPEADLAVDLMALATGRLAPKRLELSDVDVRLIIQADGGLAISAGSDPIVLASAASPGAAASPQPLRAALLDVLDLVTDPHGAIGALERVGIQHGRLVLEDRRTDRTTTFTGLDLGFDKTASETRLRLSAEGPNGRWSLDAEAQGSPGASRQFRLAVRDLSPDEIGLLAGLRDPAVDVDAPLSLTADIGLDAGNAVTAASGSVALGAGFIFAKDPDAEPVAIDNADMRLRWDGDAKRIVLDSGRFDAGATHFSVSGTIRPPDGDQADWRVEGQTVGAAALASARRNVKPVAIERASLMAAISPQSGRIAVTAMSLEGSSLHLALTGEVGFGDDPLLSIDMTARQTSGVSLAQLWPSAVSSEARLWFLDHLKDGVVDTATMAVRFKPEDFRLVADHHSPRDGAVRLDATLSGATASFLPGVPPVSAVAGVARVTGRTAQFTATRGSVDGVGARKLTLMDGTFSVPDFDIHPTPASLAAHMNGSLDSLSDILSREGLKRYANLPIDTVNVRGQVEGRITVAMKMGPGSDDPTIRADGTVTAFSVDKLLGKEKFDNGTVTVSLDPSGLKAQGQGRMFGAPAGVELRKTPTGPTEATVTVTIDDAARTRLGFPSGSGLSGPVGAKITAALGQTDRTKATAEVDFSRAAFDNLVPGLSKPAGKPAKATFGLLVDPSGTALDNIVFDGGGASLRGAVQLDAGGAFSTARLTGVRLSPGDDLRVDAQQTKDALKIVVKGAVLDARPFLRVATDTNSSATGPGGPPNLDLDLTSALVTGNNKQILSNVDLKLSRRGGAFRQFQLAAAFGRQTVSGTLTKTTEGLPQLQIASADAGALLSFLDLYKRMEGGDFLMFADLRGARVDGQIRVHDFLVRDEPALRRLVTAGVAARPQADGSLDPGAAPFSKLQVDFSKSGSRIDLRNGSIYGKQIGTTLEGWLDPGQGRVDVTGTFVPAYGLNNLFSKIPVVGAILGGGSHEGLLGINYRVSGPLSGPVLNVNPLSALAPGFLRRAFGAGAATASDAPKP